MNRECYICLLTKPKEEFNLRSTRCKECERLLQTPKSRKASRVEFAYNIYKKQAAKRVEGISGEYKLIAQTKKFLTFANKTRTFTVPAKDFEQVSSKKYEFVFKKTSYDIVKNGNIWTVL